MENEQQKETLKRKNLATVLLLALGIIICFSLEQHKIEAKIYKEPSDFQLDQIRRSVESGNCNNISKKINSLKKIKGAESNLYFFEGVCLFQEGRIEQSIQSFTKTIELDPTNADAFNNRGNLWANYENKVELAIEDYTKAIELRPEETNFRINRALAYENIEKLDEALKDLNKVIQRKPKMALAWLLRGNIKHQQKNYKEAISDFNQALWLDINLIESYTSRGLSRIALGNKRWGCHDLKLAQNRGSIHAQTHWQHFCQLKSD